MQESRMYSFLDSNNGFTLHFLEGQKLIHDLVLTHNASGNALSYYRDNILSAQQMLNFLKNGETLGFYIDSDSPYFRFKIEMNSLGNVRTLLLPENFNEFPKELNGVFRIAKIFPNKKPYNSITKMNNSVAADLINNALRDSYQTNSKVLLSQSGDQSLMITKLPAVNVDKEVVSNDLTLSEYILQKKSFINKLFQKCPSDMELIVNSFEINDLTYLASKEVSFSCSCSKERMRTNLLSLSGDDIEEIFTEEEIIEVKCDYCKTYYNFKREDL